MNMMIPLLQLLACGMLHEYEAIDLDCSSDMIAVFERFKETEMSDDTLLK